MGMLVYMLYM